MDISYKTNKVIYHRVTAKNLETVDYAVNFNGNNMLNIMHKYGSLSVEFDTTSFTNFKQDIADVYQYLQIPENTYTESSAVDLNPDFNLFVELGNVIDKVVVALESDTNAPYLLIRTNPINNYARVIQVYLRESDVDKLDILTTREYSFVYSYSIIQTFNLTGDQFVFTTSSGEFVDITLSSADITALQTESAGVLSHLNDPLTEISYEGVTSKNVYTVTVDIDDVTVSSVGYTSGTNIPYLQVTAEYPAKLQKHIYTIYMTKDQYTDFDTQLQSWS